MIIVAAIDWKRKLVSSVTSALLNQGAGKHYRSAGQAFGAINIHWGNTAPLFPRYPT
ncbi:hypothetical protein QUA46_27715 [Microcoleus sp. MON2_D6]|uniref:hypothetical protein n=1 Tax=unclassified Microcoleus TaxID=2642155 RepID=UPI002FD0EF98